MKICFKCNTKKELKDFYKHSKMKDGHLNKCKECNKKDVQNNYAKNRNYYILFGKNKIRNDINYMFLHRYSALKCRSLGRNDRKYNVTGKEFMSKANFISWCWEEKNITKFQKLHSDWVKSNYIPKLAPSIDRIDNNRGYTLDNIQWLTKSQNSKKYTFTNERL